MTIQIPYKKVVPSGIEIYYNKLIFNDKEAPINLWQLNSNEDDNTDIGLAHAHEYIQICYVHKGMIRHCLGNSKYNMVKGDIFVIPPMIPHSIERVDNQESFVYELEFDPAFININISDTYFESGIFNFAYIEPFLSFESNIRPRLNIAGEIQIKVETLFDEMVNELNLKKEGYRQYLKANLLKILVLVGREYSLSSDLNNEETALHAKYKNTILKTIHYINDNYSSDLKLEDASRYSMISQAYFSNLFKQITKKTFTEYINDLRVEKAIALLNQNEMRITDICYTVGYNEISHFNRVFKKVTGFTPSVYRKLINVQPRHINNPESSQ
jgi:AraC-like DNA-binding protein